MSADTVLLESMKVAAQDEGPGAKLRLMPAADLAALPPLKWLIRGLVPDSGFAVLYGPPGSGKSTIALDLALQVAASRAVVYIAAEGAGGYPARLLAWTKHHARPAGNLLFALEAVNLLDDKRRAELLGALGDVTPALLVVDTLARCMIGGDENSARDMGLAIDALDTIRRLTGCAVLVLHHTTKTGNSERGSSALRGAADVMLELAESDGLLTLAATKTKDSAPPPDRCLRLVSIETGRRRDDGEAETACVPLPAEKVYMAGTVTKTGRRILETLSLAIFRDSGARYAQLLADLEPMNSRTLSRALSDLKRDGLIEQSAKGDPYRISLDGCFTLDSLRTI